MPILGVVSGVTYLSVATDAQPMASIGGCPSTAFPLPAEPLVIFLFNPFPESGMRRLMANLEQSLRLHPRPAYVLKRGAPEEAIDAALAELTPEDDLPAAREAAERWRLKGGVDPRALARHLERKGFSRRAIVSVLNGELDDLGIDDGS